MDVVSRWRKWRKIARKISNFQADIALTVIYFIFVIPISTILKIFFKSNLKIEEIDDSKWIKRGKIKQNLSWAKKM